MILHEYPELGIIQKLAKSHKFDVHIVGGFLRDLVLNKPGNPDLDFAVERDALKLAKTFAKEIKGAYVLLDEKRGCARVAKKRDGKIYTYDFADYRAKTFLQDLSHRDFTINTLSLNVKDLKANSEFYDLILDYKRANKDILNKRIKRISIRSMREDPLRMMRAFSLQAALGFRI